MKLISVETYKNEHQTKVCLNTIHLFIFLHLLKKDYIVATNLKMQLVDCWMTTPSCYRPKWFWIWFYKQYIINTQEHLGEKMVDFGSKNFPAMFHSVVAYFQTQTIWKYCLTYDWRILACSPGTKTWKTRVQHVALLRVFVCITEDKTEHLFLFVSDKKVCNDIVLRTTRQFTHNNGAAHLEFNCGS